jgi:hypothetical protein
MVRPSPEDQTVFSSCGSGGAAHGGYAAVVAVGQFLQRRALRASPGGLFLLLKALSPAPVGHEEGRAPVDPEQRTTPEIPKSQFARIRTWVEYGMTAAQVAAVYGVAIEVIRQT